MPIHRRSFGRVREVLGLDPVQTELFADQSNEIEIAAEAAAAHAQ